MRTRMYIRVFSAKQSLQIHQDKENLENLISQTTQTSGRLLKYSKSSFFRFYFLHLKNFIFHLY